MYAILFDVDALILVYVKIIHANIANSVHHISSADSLAIKIRSQNLICSYLIQMWATLCSISAGTSLFKMGTVDVKRLVTITSQFLEILQKKSYA